MLLNATRTSTRGLGREIVFLLARVFFFPLLLSRCIYCIVNEMERERRTITRAPLAAFIRIVARYLLQSAGTALKMQLIRSMKDAWLQTTTRSAKLIIRESGIIAAITAAGSSGSISLFPCFVCGCTYKCHLEPFTLYICRRCLCVVCWFYSDKGNFKQFVR